LFREGIFVIEEDLKTLYLTTNEIKNFSFAFPLAFKVIDSGQMSRLKYSLPAAHIFGQINIIQMISDLFDTTPYLLEVELIQKEGDEKNIVFEKAHKHALMCVARNQFMWNREKQDMQAASMFSVYREKLWQNTGRAITFFFIQYGKKLSSETTLHQITQYYHSNSQNMESLPSYLQDFLQITKMGKKGLESFFHYLATKYVTEWDQAHAEPLPLLSCVLDLERMGETGSNDIITYLQEYITHQAESFPLFHSFSIIISSRADGYQSCVDQKKLIDLITQNEKILEENGGVKIVNPTDDERIFSNFVSQSQVNAISNKTYRVLDFLHFGNTNEKLFGIEQQQEQQAETDFLEQPRSQNTQQHALQNMDEVCSYEKEESLLITRDNIDEKININSLDNGILKKIKKLLDPAQADGPLSLRALFSVWVSGDEDAAYLITKMERAAVERILKDVAQFRMGIVKCHLPPGFKLACSAEGGLILCFSLRHERDDLKPDSVWRKQKSPFTIILLREKPMAIQ
jgi:hypothetical protein